jgi:hypothetical protein
VSDEKAEADWVAETEAEPRVLRFGAETRALARGLRAVVVVEVEEVRRLEAAARVGFEVDAVRP